jgi:uncharacterized membrane protein YeiH
MGARGRAAVGRYVLWVVLSLPAFITLAVRDRTNEKADALIIAWTNYLGDASFALTGSVAAGGEGMDIVGCVVVGFITALGGGSCRDILLGRVPLWWLVHWDETLLCVLVSLVAFILWPRLALSFRSVTTEAEILFWTDTVGLAVFAANGGLVGATLLATATHGAETPVPYALHVGGASACGMFTATFGGLTRDVLVRRPARILHSIAEVYALPALLGGFCTSAVVRWAHGSVTHAEAVVLGMSVTTLMRVVAQNHGVRLPGFPLALVRDDRRFEDSGELQADLPPLSTPATSATRPRLSRRAFVIAERTNALLAINDTTVDRNEVGG